MVQATLKHLECQTHKSIAARDDSRDVGMDVTDLDSICVPASAAFAMDAYDIASKLVGTCFTGSYHID